MNLKKLFLCLAFMLTACMCSAQLFVILGHVQDSDTGEAIVGATILNHNSKGGAVSDIDGNFSLIANPGNKIEVKYVGYYPITFTVSQNTKAYINVSSMNYKCL